MTAWLERTTKSHSVVLLAWRFSADESLLVCAVCIRENFLDYSGISGICSAAGTVNFWFMYL